MRRRVLFYVQHLLGIGHLSRAGLITDALADAGFDVTLVMGGIPVPAFAFTEARTVQLPAIRIGEGGFSDLVDQNGVPVTTEFKENRARRLLEVFSDLVPDCLIVEAFPFGRRQMMFELLPLLDAAKDAYPKPLIVSSIRDILQTRSAHREQETLMFLQKFFDHVFVHGDPAFSTLQETFRPGVPAEKLIYTGIVAPPEKDFSGAKEGFDIVVSAGGGAVGEHLLETVMDVAASAVFPDLSWLVIAGAHRRPAENLRVENNARPNVTLCSHRADFRALLRRCRVSISQAGYNTAADILVAGCRSILVPFARGGETEQSARAAKLRDAGRCAVIDEDDLTPERLIDTLSRSLAAPVPGPLHALRLDGAAKTAHLLKALLD